MRVVSQGKQEGPESYYIFLFFAAEGSWPQADWQEAHSQRILASGVEEPADGGHLHPGFLFQS